MRKPASPQLRFLLRASLLLGVLLILWWGLLVHPLLATIRLSTAALLHLLPGGGSTAEVTIASNGDWLVRVPIPQFLANTAAVQRAYGGKPGGSPVKVRSIRLAIAERTPTFFTLSFPLFWAVVLAAPRSRRLWWILAEGTGLLLLLALLSLLFYIAFTIETNVKMVTSDLGNLLWGGVEYLNVNVVPYVAPLLMALWLHQELRGQILFSEAPEAAPAIVAGKPRRGRYRAR